MAADIRCSSYRDSLGARLDGELLPGEAREVDEHLSTCASCARDYQVLADTHRIVSENLMRYKAPDVLKARIRGALSDTAVPRVDVPRGSSWWRLMVAGIAIAAASSALTFGTIGRSAGDGAADELLASHVRSLMPGHLTDVLSTNQHNVKPWFNGRVDVSPSVPGLDGFPLVGGRADYVRGRAVPVVVYARRQHLINVYEWPSDGQSSAVRGSTRNGYHLMTWRSGGMEYWAVSDLNTKELRDFVTAFNAAR